MATRVRTRTYGSVSLGFLLYLAIGLIVTISQDYWNVTDWDGATLRHFFTAVVATLAWPLAIFYSIGLTPR
ncbi:hypothetical protein CcI49_01365 [Frankia sp. CcI49]|uniref:Uncharacterized protein n=1 Tax=Parafrankia irregularis TaxID=795642 RepID=A0A0S4QK41_9ACTN|nr:MULTISPECIES: hypothetical protein [Frankiaceae]EFC85177.1 hypothetical protein FrEUN1fDRAFT_1630 [Parafrankia sp. EUN1f]KPM56476.1 hypothetical protein ACG83_00550 [Frankia sp. R43]MBE3202167.1 hypothetical protein [Parafrankia sp. CH37]ONH62095.1 hypothetical protein CcI49_01365 [Frankia sp. CcI49]CUU55953.1 hypothetical protein Ga0074812_106208 [Parafrankia irregularis]